MAEDFGEKTEAPTAKRKRDAVEQGDVLRSREFGTALVITAGCGWLALFGRSLVAACERVMASSLAFDRADVDDFEPFGAVAHAVATLATPMIALFAIALAAAVLSQAGLGALRFNLSLIAPKASRIDPAAGLQRIFGANGWIELGKSLLKVTLLGSVGGYMLWAVSKTSIALVSSDVMSAIGALGASFLQILFAMAGGLLLIAGIDVPVQLIRLLTKLGMSKQQVREEAKETEGSPEAKGAIRARQREVFKRNIRAAVAEAHVVLTNPTHFAVALRYDRASDQVPVVVARGRGVLAQAIRELADEARVPILEYPAVARAVYYTSREGQEVRDDLYVAIATILAFVFGLNTEAQGAPPVEVPRSARFDENGLAQA